MKRFFSLLGTLSLIAFLAVPVQGQSGHIMNGVSPLDQGMSGAGMAAPQDALTALHWNPASIFAVPGRTLDLSLQLMMPSGSLQSTVQTGAFGQVPSPAGGMMPFPWADLDGTTDSEAGPFPIPSIGYSYSSPDSKFAYGLSALGVGGFGVDYVLSPSNLATGTLPANAILSAQQANGGIGFGAIESTFMLLQISPTFAYRLTDQISIGVAPTINMASLELSVMPAAAPQMFLNPMDPSGTSFLALYPDAPAEWATGFGFQVGLYGEFETFNASVSYKSNQAFSDFEFEPTTPGAENFTFQLDYPAILSAGVAFTGLDGLLLAADVRYIDFENTVGFDKTGFGPQGQVLGFGWNSITVIALGAQYEVMEGLPIRIGYSINDNPIEEDTAFFNTPAPAIIEQHVSGGFSYQITEKLQFSFAAQLGLENEIGGPWKTISPTGSTVSIPNTSATNTLSTFTLIGGVHITL